MNPPYLALLPWQRYVMAQIEAGGPIQPEMSRCNGARAAAEFYRQLAPLLDRYLP